MSKQITFVSVWSEGITIETNAMLDEDADIVSDIEMAHIPDSFLEELESLEREYVIIDGNEYDVERNDDGTYAILREYMVFFSRNGCVRVMATSRENAMQIADETVKYDDVSWDDDWNAVDAQMEDGFSSGDSISGLL